MVRTEATADDSLAAIRARSKFGMAIAAMIRMIATTISNSISEKPFCFRISFSLFSDLKFLVFTDRLANIFALCWPESGLRVRVTKESGCPPADGSFLWRIMPFLIMLSRLGLLQFPQFRVRFCRRLTNCVRLRPGEQFSTNWPCLAIASRKLMKAGNLACGRLPLALLFLRLLGGELMKTTFLAAVLCATSLAAPAPPQNAFSPNQIKFGPVPPVL